MIIMAGLLSSMLLYVALFYTLLTSPTAAAFQQTTSPLALVAVSQGNKKRIKSCNYLHQNEHVRSFRPAYRPSDRINYGMATCTERQASETSYDLGDIFRSVGTQRLLDLRDKVVITWGRSSQLSRKTLQKLQQLSTPSINSTTMNLVRKSWWIVPMFLALVPIYCTFVTQTCATTPNWWKLVNIKNFLNSESATLVITAFLFSNISFFLSGLYLLKRFPPVQSSQGKGIDTKEGGTSRLNRHFRFPKRRFVPTKYTMLGVWIIAAGLVSTIFHSVQVLGSYSVAESWCYVDHGFAISATLYYFDTCGKPSRLVLAFGLAGLAALVTTGPGYAWFHSLWHLLSAAAATIWGIQGYNRRIQPAVEPVQLQPSSCKPQQGNRIQYEET